MASDFPNAQPVAEWREGGALLHLEGRWRLTEPHPRWSRLIPSSRPAAVRVSCGEIESWDSSLLLFIYDLDNWCRENSVTCDLGCLPGAVRQMLERMRKADCTSQPVERGEEFVETVGLSAIGLLRRTQGIFHFVGECVLSVLKFWSNPRKFRWHDALDEMQAAGAMALPIISLISALVGLTLAYTGAIILRQFGADIWVADLVSLSMVREMGPVMAAIVMAGRTGAAYAARIGNMRANEEVDALETLGIPAIDFLVMPRLLALGLMMPLLTLYANALGIFGGLIVASTVLDIPPAAYWVEMLTSVDLSDVVSGLIKACCFGLLVGLSGCFCGLRADRSSAGVGQAATSAVVTGILLIVVSDSLFAVIFNFLGI